MDAGQVAEMDTPINLYLKPDGIFRTLCEHSNITLDDLKLARKILQEDME
jgi:ATP-binding cassette subfamily C (CFTR/MRP) protein 1